MRRMESKSQIFDTDKNSYNSMRRTFLLSEPSNQHLGKNLKKKSTLTDDRNKNRLINDVRINHSDSDENDADYTFNNLKVNSKSQFFTTQQQMIHQPFEYPQRTNLVYHHQIRDEPAEIVNRRRGRSGSLSKNQKQQQSSKRQTKIYRASDD